MMNETIELSAWVWVPLLVLTWVWGVGMMAGMVGRGSEILPFICVICG